MTILSAKNTPRNTYTATAGQTAFTIGFEFFSVNDVKVYKNGTLMTYDASPSTNTTYKITGTASASDDAYEFGAGGTVTFGSGVALNDSIVIIRDITIERTTDFNPSGAFDISTLNTQLDTIMSIMADTQEQTNRSVKLSDTDVTSATVTLPTNADRASKVLSFDASGNAEATLTTTGLSTLSGITSDITTVAGIASDVTTVAGISANVTTVSGISGNVTTVAGISSDVTTTAGISSNVTTVAGLSTEITALSGVSSQDLIDVAALGTELQTLAPIASDITTVAGVSGNVTTVAGISSDVSTVSGISANTTTVAGISGNVTTVAGISSDVSTVAGISANVTTVAGDTVNIASVAGNSANINAVASNETNINAVNSNSSNINSVAGNATNINTVAGNTTNINTVATNITDVNTFANRYRISATDPTTSLDIGDLYYDTTNDIMKVYGSSGWQNAGSSVNGTSARFQYSVSSSTTTITGTDDNGNSLLYDAGYVDVYLNGIKMVNGSDVTVTSGTSVVFATAIGTSGTDTVDIIAYGTFNVAAIDATSITSGTLGYARGGTGLGTLGSADEVLQMNAGGTALEYGKVDTANIADDAVTSAKIADNNVGAAELNVSGNGTSGQVLSSDGDGTFSWADSASPFAYNAVSGTTPSLDVGTYNFFDNGTLAGNTTVSFTNVPTEAKWSYSFIGALGGGYDILNQTGTTSNALGNTWLLRSSSDVYNMYVKNDGTSIYIGEYGAGNGSYAAVHQFNLSTAHDISTMSYYGNKGVGPETLGYNLYGFKFSPDGSHFYTSHYNNRILYQYDMTTAWDVTTASYASKSLNFSSQIAGDPAGLVFNDDGTKLFIGRLTTKTIYQYNLSTAYDISTASYASISATFSSADTPYELHFNDDGTKLITTSNNRSDVHSLSTAYDITTATYVGNASNAATGIFASGFSNNGEYYYVLNASGKNLYQTSAAAPATITLPASVQNTPSLNIVNGARFTYDFFTADSGTNVYITNENKAVT